MRIVASLASAKFTLLSRSSSASRTADGEYLFWAEFLFHRKPQVKKWSTKPVPGSGLRSPNHRHGPILQKGADKCAIYLQTSVVMDEAFLLERAHKFTYPCAGGTNHLRQGCLAHLQGIFRL